MVKRKGRAARKQQRDKAVKAVGQGLPAAELAPKPQKTRKVGGDTVAAAMASEKAGRARPARRPATQTEPNKPVVVKVLIGAAVALAVVYGLSHLRKSGDISSAPQRTSGDTDSGSSVETSVGPGDKDAPFIQTSDGETSVSTGALAQDDPAASDPVAPASVAPGPVAPDLKPVAPRPSDPASPAAPARSSASAPPASATAPRTTAPGARAPTSVPLATAPAAPAPAATAPAAPAPAAPAPAATEPSE